MRYYYSILLRMLCVLFVVSGVTLSAADTLPIEQRGYVKNDLLVSVDWTKEHLNNGDILVLDARAKKDYGVRHIRGAISAPWKMFADMKAPMGKGFTMLLSPKKLTNLFQKIGITDKKTIVVYANPDAWGEDGRIAWMLKMAGLTNVKMLDGGWPAWKEAKGSTSRVETKSTSSDIVITKMNEEMLATTEWIVENRKNIIMLDTRATDEWEGATKYGEKRGGHIKDAIHMEWSTLFNEDKTVKTQAQIEEIMKKAGIEKSDTIVSYCTAGIRSAYMTLALRMAGYTNAKNYAASLYEWAAKSELPMEK